MKIQHTNISKRTDELYAVDILIAEKLDPALHEEQYHFVCYLRNVPKNVALPSLEKAALDHVQKVIEQQTQALAQA